MSILKAEVPYYPFQLPTCWSQGNFAVDEIKMNLLWLVYPEVDTVIDLPWEGNEISSSIDTMLDQGTRLLIKEGFPLEFVRQFTQQDHYGWEMTACWPPDYVSTMFRRAREAQDRIKRSVPENVILVDFRRGRRAA